MRELASVIVGVALTLAWGNAAGFARAADAKFGSPVAGPGARPTPLTSPRFSVELFGGYLSGLSRELVYNVPGDRSKLSQLNWQIDSAAILGGEVRYRAFDWLSLRGRGWVHATSDNAMDDFDWLFGYQGFESWSDVSRYRDTRISKAYQIDVSASVHIMEAGTFTLNALLGYRYQTMKWNAYGGSFIYSTNGFRDEIGSFAADEISIAYQQWWHAPYVGFGATYGMGPVTLGVEVIGTPLVAVHDRDNHVESLFKEAFRPTSMAAAVVSAELAVNQQVSLVARAEVERFFEAKGGIKEYDFDPPAFERSPRPAAGADHQSLLVSLGAKARF